MKTICIGTLAWFFLLAATAWPQASTSTVRGAVRDQTQAVVPWATVRLTNTETNVARTTTTNEVGIYVFPGVTPGPYRITMEAPGFQKFEGTLTVQVQQDATVDGVLVLGQAATQVEVKDVTPMVRVDSPALGHALERQRIEQLPINGRGYQALLATVPGITGTGRISAYGLRPGSHTLLFDGSQMNEVWEGWDFGRAPGMDAIEEFRVEVNSSSAKFTRPTTIILSSKSGTNSLHGALFETNRNSGYGVARRRQDSYQKPPFLNRNEFGASAGGPVYLPKVYNGRNRTFWFFAWEATRNLSNSTQQWTVPTQAMRDGDFRGLVDSQGRQYTLYDPFTTDPKTWHRQPVTYRGIPNTIDPARLSPTAKYLFSITPLPTLPQVNPLVDNNWVGPAASRQRHYTTSTRIDHRFSDKNLIYTRFTYGGLYEEYQYSSQVMLNKVPGLVNRTDPGGSVLLTWLRVFSPTLTNELMATGTWDNQWRGTGDGKTDYAALLGLPNPFKAVSWPAITGMDLRNYAYNQDGPFWLSTKYVTVQDNATKVSGRHEFLFGLHFKNEYIDKSNVPWAGGDDSATMATSLYDPTSTPTSPLAQPFTGHGMANFYLGVFNYGSWFKRPWWLLRRQEYAPYFQDNWKVTPRLTLNLGIRYEYRTPIHEKNNTLHGFSLDKRAFVVGTDTVDDFLRFGATLPSIVAAIQRYGGNIISYKDAGLPQRLMYNNWWNFGPRVGVAYRVGDGAKSFVVRSGYRLSAYTMPIQGFIAYQGFSTPISVYFQNSVMNTTLSPDGLPNYGLRSVPKYIAGISSTSSIIDLNDTRTLYRGFADPYYLDPHQPDPQVHDWNLTLEKEPMQNTVVRFAYVGNYSYNVQQITRQNESTPAYIWYITRREPLPTGEYASVGTNSWDRQSYGAVRNYGPMGCTRFNGFQAEFERRYSRGLGFQVFYLTGNTLGATDADEIRGVNYYLPGAVPSAPAERNRFLNYKRDTAVNKHKIQWNFIADLPFGRGKMLGRNVGGLVEKLIGGWQIAGMGNWRSSYWSLPTNVYQTTGQKIEIYGYRYPIQDCRSGVCYPGYLWWNGYIPSNQINSSDASGKPNGVMGVPSSYRPAAQPLIPWGQTALPANAPASTNLRTYWDTNTVWILLNNGTVQRTTFNDNMHPWRNQYIPGPLQWFQDASLFKFVNLTERVTMRINVDFFNALNNPNNPTSVSGDGILSTRNSGSSARTTQLTMRLMW